LKKIPHAAFRVKDSLPDPQGSHWARLLEMGLREHFQAIKAQRHWTIVQWKVSLKVGSTPFTILIGRSKFGGSEWVLLVAPLEDKPDAAAGDGLISICREVHRILAQSPDLVNLRWYFEDFSSQTAAVATPDELPWT
jgi:hypothetical protein